MARRQYTDLERTAALASLAAHGGDLPATARATAIPESTLRRWSEAPAFPLAASAAAVRPSVDPDARAGLNTQHPIPNTHHLRPNTQDLYGQLAAVADNLCAALQGRM